MISKYYFTSLPTSIHTVQIMKVKYPTMWKTVLPIDRVSNKPIQIFPLKTTSDNLTVTKKSQVGTTLLKTSGSLKIINSKSRLKTYRLSAPPWFLFAGALESNRMNILSHCVGPQTDYSLLFHKILRTFCLFLERHKSVNKFSPFTRLAFHVKKEAKRNYGQYVTYAIRPRHLVQK